MSETSHDQRKGTMYSRCEESFVRFICFIRFGISDDQGNIAVGIGANCLEEWMNGVEESIAGSANVNMS